LQEIDNVLTLIVNDQARITATSDPLPLPNATLSSWEPPGRKLVKLSNGYIDEMPYTGMTPRFFWQQDSLWNGRLPRSVYWSPLAPTRYATSGNFQLDCGAATSCPYNVLGGLDSFRCVNSIPLVDDGSVT